MSLEQENFDSNSSAERRRNFPAILAEAALAAYVSLPKTGKPQPHEHTVLAAIAVTGPLFETSTGKVENCKLYGFTDDAYGENKKKDYETPVIVALATGTKCLPGSKRANDGSALHDCHAGGCLHNI